FGEIRAEAGLATVPLEEENAAPTIAHVVTNGGIGALVNEVDVGRMLMSLEVFVEERHLAGRAREDLDIQLLDADRPAMSDLLLIQPRERRPNSLDEAVRTVRGSNRTRP